MSHESEEEKRRLRRRIAALRAGVPAQRAAAAAGRIAAHLLADPAVARARRIALYAALPDEVPTRPLFEALAARRASLVFPRVQDERALVFAAVADWSELRPGRYGVLEPPAEAPAARPAQGDLVLVPGVAFDRSGRRLGRGGGFYDRAFAPGAEGAPLLVGVAYAFQLVPVVPATPADRRMDGVVSEEGLLWMAGLPA
jgi:5-formyltetrahydrofolate cyclo-ligase